MRRTWFAASFFAIVLAASSVSGADYYEIDPAHSSITFSIKHLVGRVTGRFLTFSGSIVADSLNVGKSTVSARIAVDSIDTDNQRRDTHLRSPDFFDTAKYPEIVFESKSVERQPPGKAGTWLLVKGTLTMHGVAKDVSLPVEVTGMGKDPWGGTRAGFESSLVLSRKDFGISWNQTLDQGGLVLGNEVSVNLAIEAVRKSEAAPK